MALHSSFPPGFPSRLPDEVKEYLISRDPCLERLFREVKPLNFHELYKPTYVALVCAILGQIISYSEAKKLRSKLYSSIGTTFGIDDVDRIVDSFPLRVSTILRNLNKWLRDNNINEYLLNDLNFPLEKLREISGIGPWTISTTQLTAFRNWNIYPPNDKWLQKKIKQLYNLDHLPSQKEQLNLSSNWSPYQTIVTWYLWRWF